MSRWQRTWKPLTVAILLAAAFLAQRIFVTVEVGGDRPGVVELLPLVMMGTAIAWTIRSRGLIAAPFLTRHFLLVWGPYLALTMVLPILGVIVGGYPLRTIAAVEIPFVAMSAMLLGSGLRLGGQGTLAEWQFPMLIAIVVVAGYAVLQQLLVGDVLPAGPWSNLISWDVATQHAYSPNVILGRSSAFYVNPNILGAAAGASLLIGLSVARGWCRYLTMFASLEALLLSQSRGATLAVIAGVGLLLLFAVQHHETVRPRAAVAYAGVTGLALALWLALVALGTPAETFIGRITQGISVVGGGSDPNVAGRIEFWRAGLDLLASHPLGTLGSPERLLGTAVDSDWVRALLQGSVIYGAALALALFGGALVFRSNLPEWRLFAALSVFVAVAALTQLPLEYPGAILYWALVGTVAAMSQRRTGSQMEARA